MSCVIANFKTQKRFFFSKSDLEGNSTKKNCSEFPPLPCPSLLFAVTAAESSLEISQISPTMTRGSSFAYTIQILELDSLVFWEREDEKSVSTHIAVVLAIEWLRHFKFSGFFFGKPQFCALISWEYITSLDLTREHLPVSHGLIICNGNH